ALITCTSMTMAVPRSTLFPYTTLFRSAATAGAAFNFTVTALDAFNNTATGFAGTVGFSSTDAQAVLPAASTLTNGTGTFSATLKTPGNQTIKAASAGMT